MNDLKVYAKWGWISNSRRFRQRSSPVQQSAISRPRQIEEAMRYDVEFDAKYIVFVIVIFHGIRERSLLGEE